tara:strand:- start:215 stop:424 length:210 start_codon:yes stop_codon:yes gene_type:complete
MDLESKEFKIALKEIPKEYKIDEKKVFITGKAVLNKVPTTKKKKNVDKDKKIVNKKQKKNVNKKYKSKK